MKGDSNKSDFRMLLDSDVYTPYMKGDSNDNGSPWHIPSDVYTPYMKGDSNELVEFRIYEKMFIPLI